MNPDDSVPLQYSLGGLIWPFLFFYMIYLVYKTYISLFRGYETIISRRL